MQLEIPKFRWLAQDEDGDVYVYVDKPCGNIGTAWYAGGDGFFDCIIDGETNPNWRDTLIDLETDQYAYSDGILRRL